MPKVCAYSTNEGKSISNPIGWCCLSSLIEVKFDSINLSPAKYQEYSSIYTININRVFYFFKQTKMEYINHQNK